MQTTQDLNESFKEGYTPVNIGKATIKFLRKGMDTVVVSVPSKTTTSCCQIQEVAIIHEIGEKGSTVVMENASPLVTREKCFIKITYDHPRSVNVLVNVKEVGPEMWAQGRVRACVDASASSGGIVAIDGEGYGEIAKVKNS